MIRVGLIRINTNEAQAGVGAASGSGSFNPEADKAQDAAVDAVNAAGGIAGRKVEPVFYKSNFQNLLSPQGRQQEIQAACAKWTEDTPVFAMDMAFGTNESAADCAAKSRTPWIHTNGQGGLFVSQERFSKMAPYYYRPTGFLADRRERAMGSFLIRHGFFEPGAKVGLVVEDRPDHRAGVDRGLKPALAAAGIKPVLEIAYPDPIEAPWQNYVLQLQTAGVTNVIFSATSVAEFPALFMMRTAENQRYHPKWAFGSDMDPSKVATDNAPEAQLLNTQAMGWWPVLDTGDVSPQEGDAVRRCYDAGKRHGITETNPDAIHVLQGMCDLMFFLKSGLERAPEISPAGLAAGVASLAGTYPSAAFGSTSFGPNRHDGVSTVRLLVYDANTKRFRYAGSPEPAPN